MTLSWPLALSTTLCGLAQGLAATLALAELASLPMRSDFLADALALALLLLLAAPVVRLSQRFGPAGDGAALRRRQGAWPRREALWLAALLAAGGLWWLALQRGWDLAWLPLAVLLAAAALWLCTAMTLASMRPARDGSQPLTLANIVLCGLGSGMALACVLAAWQQQQALLLAAGPIALLLVAAAGLARAAALWRQSALTPVRPLQWGLLLPAFVLPAGLLALGLALDAVWPWPAAWLLQLCGLLADRGLFIADARRPAPPDAAPAS